MKRLWVGIVVLGVIALGVGLLLWLRPGEDATPAAKPRREPSAEVLKQRGPRPSETRLRVGAKQIEDPGQALDLARESLARAEKEISAARTDEERARLAQKKLLIEQAISRLQGEGRDRP